VSPVLQAEGLRFSYAGDPVIDSVSFSVDPGEFVALVGSNGSGKSTLLRLVLGLLSPQAGQSRLFDRPAGHLDQPWRLGYVAQRPRLGEAVTATVEEVVAAGALARRGWWRRLRAEDRAEIDHALDSVALSTHRRRPLVELSGGQQQRAFIAKALVCRPDLLVLDEPVAGVDADSQRRFRDSLVHLVREHGSAILLVSHELGAVAADLDRVLVLRRGALAFDGPPAELTASGVSLGVHHDDLPVWLEGLE
jgi:zinc transport system ATP-binding protein